MVVLSVLVFLTGCSCVGAMLASFFVVVEVYFDLAFQLESNQEIFMSKSSLMEGEIS